MLTLMLVVLAAPSPGAPKKASGPAVGVTVFAASADEKAAASLEKKLTDALRDADVTLQDPLAAFPPPPVDDSGAKLVAAAKQAYDDLDYEAAATKWQEALQFFTQHPEAATSKGLGEIHFFIGVLAIQNGGKAQTKKGTEEFHRALVHDPDLQCDASTYGKDVKAAFDKGLQEVTNKGTGALTIESTPPGAEVTFKGRALGTTPLAEPLTVPVGRHLVLYSHLGYAPTGVLADVSKDGTTASKQLVADQGYLDLREAAATLTRQVGKKGKLPAGAKKVGDLVHARFLLLSDGAQAELWDTQTGNRLTGLAVADAELPKTVTRVKDFVARPTPAGAAVADAEVAEPAPGGPVYKQWWFWTAVGVVAVGSATTIGVVAANNSGGRPYNVLLGLP